MPRITGIGAAESSPTSPSSQQNGRTNRRMLYDLGDVDGARTWRTRAAEADTDDTASLMELLNL